MTIAIPPSSLAGARPARRDASAPGVLSEMPATQPPGDADRWPMGWRVASIAGGSVAAWLPVLWLAHTL